MSSQLELFAIPADSPAASPRPAANHSLVPYADAWPADCVWHNSDAHGLCLTRAEWDDKHPGRDPGQVRAEGW